MTWLSYAKIRLLLVVFLVAIVLRVGSSYADFTFSAPIELGHPIWSPGHDPQGCCFSRDGLELYFASTRPGGYGFFDIWVATREAVDSPWGEPINLGPNVNTSGGECAPAISPDGLELYFTLYQDRNIRVCSRSSKDAPWSNPAVLGPPVGTYDVYCPEVSADGLELYFLSYRPDGYGDADIWVSNRDTTSDPWQEPINLGPTVNSMGYDGYPSISSDGLALFFCSERPDGYGGGDIWVTTRPTTDAKWGPPVNYPSLNQSRDDWGAAISPDGSMLYFESIYNFWQCSIIPIVDFNGDGIVDVADMCIMVDHWGENYSLCDIGPTPWGDGIVDVEDLEVLAKHLFEEPGLIAYWMLDETEGDIAYDNTDNCNGILIGDPVWQPDAGMVAGAIECDGNDDHIITDYVLDPVDGPFSVFAWIQGGAPGQVVISQQSMSNWLKTDADGNLMTELKCTGRSAGYLFSETVITDGQWHRIGLVWDGANRALYVDGIMVAEDTQHGLEGSERGLYIGTGKFMESGTFFSGLIDDVRIYNRAVSP